VKVGLQEQRPEKPVEAVVLQEQAEKA